MRSIGWAIVIAAGCSYQPHAGAGDGSGPPDDGADGPEGAPTDARCVIGSLDLCGQAPPDAPLTLTGTIDTGSDPRCRAFVQAGGAPACLVYAEQVTVGALAGIGTLPLVIASAGDLHVDGVLDVSSRRGGQVGAGAVGAGANDASCTVQRQAESDAGGAAGAAGGSFHGKGGDGGEGDTDDSLGGDGTALPGLAGTAIDPPAFARGGCAGAHGGDEGGGGTGGAGGASGGAVWLAANGTVAIGGNGGIRATGAGGEPGQVQSGGGGGGSGGMIVVEAAAIVVGGGVSANGGGGGEGGTRLNTTAVTGTPGSDGDMTAAAPGGSGAPGSAGDGGAGSAGGVLDGGAGMSTIVGAGGGGGGAGLVHLVGAVSGAGTVTPPAS